MGGYGRRSTLETDPLIQTPDTFGGLALGSGDNLGRTASSIEETGMVTPFFPLRPPHKAPTRAQRCDIVKMVP